jgi:N-acylneuraminate cytidylyltransferase
MKVLAIIPARGGSKGIPQKNLKKLNGKPLIFHTINACQKSKNVNKIIVSTDDAKISKYAQSLGAEIISRPKKISGDSAEVEFAMMHVLKKLEKQKYFPDIVTLIQPTSPLRSYFDIDEAFTRFYNGHYDSVFSGYISKYFLWKKNKSKIIPLNYSPNKRPTRQEMKSNLIIENGAIYITKFSKIKKSKCRISGKIGVYLMHEVLSIDINTLFDFTTSEQIMKSNFYKQRKKFDNL